eukprot:TRINITY_DN6683_c0_g1_i1.p1 TRINITY_DN6683_c0_g1~~TRINITY_DN6683_c0_g1_i1.p1  ORF type:complete len:500 (+),score=153.07 TRINITY_DN6683_c0_g1_i1:69-1568(+)
MASKPTSLIKVKLGDVSAIQVPSSTGFDSVISTLKMALSLTEQQSVKLTYQDAEGDTCLIVNDATLEVAREQPFLSAVLQEELEPQPIPKRPQPSQLKGPIAKAETLMVATDEYGTFTLTGHYFGSKTFRAADQAIQAGVDYISANFQGLGGTVMLEVGIYPLTNTITLADRVHLLGRGRATELTVISGVGVQLTSLNGARVSDLAIVVPEGQKATTGLVLSDCGDCNVDNVFASGFDDYGIQLTQNSFLCEIRGCKTAGNGKTGFQVDTLSMGRGGDFLPSILSSCQSYGDHVGFVADDALVINFVGCQVHQSLSYGFYITNQSNSCILSGCRTFQVGSDAVFVDNSYEFNMSSTIVCWTRGHGVHLKDVSWATVASNNIIDNGVRHHTPSGDTLQHGVYLEGACKGVQVTGNAIFNWGDQVPMSTAIMEEATCLNSLIASNNINYFKDAAVTANGQNSLVTDIVAQGYPSYAHQGGDTPDFTTDAIMAFIKEERSHT